MPPPVGLSNLQPYNHILYGLAFLAVLIPAPIHFKSRNTGLILFICWLLAAELIFFINSFIWKGNVNDPIPYYCDVTVAIIGVTSHGLTAATICINRQLYRLAKAQAVIISKSQGHRYDIYEDVGCLPTTYNVTVAYPLYFAWPPVLAIVSAIYGMLALRQFLKRRKSFESLLSSTSSGIPKNRYIRLMWLCSLDLLISLPYYLFTMIDNLVNRKVYPWVSWADTQADWYRVDRFRRIIIDMVPAMRVPLYCLMFGSLFMSLIFVIVFGFTRETIKAYTNAYYWCLRPFGVKRPERTTANGLPRHHQHGPKKRTWWDKVMGREAGGVPLNSVSNTTGSIPTFLNGPSASAIQSKSIPSARPKGATTFGSSTLSATDTLNFDDFDGDDGEYGEKKYGKMVTTPTPTPTKAREITGRPRSDHSGTEKSPFSSGDTVPVPHSPPYSAMSGASVMVIDGRRLTIPGLNAMASFDSDELNTNLRAAGDDVDDDEKEQRYYQQQDAVTPTTTSSSITYGGGGEEREVKTTPKMKYKGPSRI
ncbi:a-factor receptor [Serendipita sp. 399]|nr:a-factor receptor [Serendipita sp. 399]